MSTTDTTSTTASPRFQIPGDLLSTNAAATRSQLDAYLASREGNGAWTVLELDLRRAAMVDSVGLNFLVSLHKRLSGEGKRLRVLILSESVKRILRFTRLDQYVEVAEG